MHQPSMATTTSPTINEHARSAIALPVDTTFYSDTQFIPIAWDEPGDGSAPRPDILFSKPGHLPYYPKYQLIDLLCGDRARQAVDGTLRVQGQVVTPEAYLGLWRAALADSLTPVQLAARCGLRLFVSLGAALEAVRAAKSSWTSSPFPTFEAFEVLYGERFTHGPTADGRSGFELTLDLREPDAARDAFYAESLISRKDDAASYVRTWLAPISIASAALPSPERQTSLFEGASQ